MNSKRFQEVSSLLQNFLLAVTKLRDMNGWIWYFALCLDFQLDVTITIEHFEVYNKFYMTKLKDITDKKYQKSRARFMVNCLLWSLRHKNFKAAKLWRRRLNGLLEIHPDSIITDTFTMVRFLESLSLFLLVSYEIVNITQLKAIKKDSKEAIKTIGNALKTTKLFVQRFELLCLHQQMLEKFSNKCVKKLSKLEAKAVKSKDFLILDIIRHTRRTWKRELPPNIERFWINHSLQSGSFGVNELLVPDRVFPYSLPLNLSRV